MELRLSIVMPVYNQYRILFVVLNSFAGLSYNERKRIGFKDGMMLFSTSSCTTDINF